MSGEHALDQWRHDLVAALRADADEPEASPAAPAAGRLELLALELGTETYGVGIRDVAEILLPRAVTPVPRAPAFVLGVMSLRGSVLPVVDLGARLGLAPTADGRGSRVVVLRDGAERLGFRVDRVRGVIRFGGGEVQATEFGAAVDPVFLRGVGYDRGGTLVAVLSAPALCEFDLETR
ncbi:MAG: chemotaxis protein CheW [Deferrisomatales bacterium]